MRFVKRVCNMWNARDAKGYEWQIYYEKNRAQQYSLLYPNGYISRHDFYQDAVDAANKTEE